MSKEQTPITAEEYLKDFSNLKFNGEVRWNNTDILIIMEQYAQAKVLEALEGEIEQAFIYGYNTGCFDSFTQPLEIQSIPAAEKYYETEVKPNYE